MTVTFESKLTNQLLLKKKKNELICLQKTGFISFYRIRNLNLNLTATEKAVGKQTIAAVKQAEITEQSVVIQAEKADAEEALQEALPALEAARLALADLEKNDITEIRSFATPPEAVQVSNEDEKGVH